MTDEHLTDGTNREPYSLGDAPGEENAGVGDGGGTGLVSAGEDDDEPVGVPVPEEHVGAFVAQAFEDPERTTEWGDVVDAMVAPAAREAWESLSPVEQTVEVLDKATEYDRRATDELERIPTNAGDPTPDIRSQFAEARRLRRNADLFRDGVAAAYAEGRIDDDDIVAAVERSAFDSTTVARREDELERVTSVYDFDYRPYGGTLFDEDEAAEGDHDGPEAF